MLFCTDGAATCARFFSATSIVISWRRRDRIAAKARIPRPAAVSAPDAESEAFAAICVPPPPTDHDAGLGEEPGARRGAIGAEEHREARPLAGARALQHRRRFGLGDPREGRPAREGRFPARDPWRGPSTGRRRSSRDFPELGQTEPSRDRGAGCGVAPLQTGTRVFPGTRSRWGGRSTVRTALAMGGAGGLRPPQVEAFYDTGRGRQAQESGAGGKNKKALPLGNLQRRHPRRSRVGPRRRDARLDSTQHSCCYAASSPHSLQPGSGVFLLFSLPFGLQGEPTGVQPFICLQTGGTPHIPGLCVMFVDPVL